MAFSQLVEPYNHVDASGGDLLEQQLFVNAFPLITNDDDHWPTSEYYGAREDKSTFALTNGVNIRNMLEQVSRMSADFAMTINFE